MHQYGEVDQFAKRWSIRGGEGALHLRQSTVRCHRSAASVSIAFACQSSQSWITHFKMYASPPLGNVRKKSLWNGTSKLHSIRTSSSSNLGFKSLMATKSVPLKPDESILPRELPQGLLSSSSSRPALRARKPSRNCSRT